MALTKVTYAMIEGASINPSDYGADPTGVDDSSEALETVFSLSDCVVDGNYATYKLDSAITPTGENIVIQNMTLDLSDNTTADRIVKFSGTASTAVNLTANCLAGTSTVTVGNTSTFSAGQYAQIRSSKLWSDQDSKSWYTGHIVKIKSVDSGTQLTLAWPVLYDFNTSDTAYIQPISVKNNITFKNVNFIGNPGVNQIALDFVYCADVVVDNCSFDGVDYGGLYLEQCIDVNVQNSTFKNANGSGSSYGVAVTQSSYAVNISNCYGENLRHLVTIGGTNGVNLYVKAIGNHATQCRDAGLDSHAAGDYITFADNTVEAATGIFSDGIILQCANHTVTGNTVVGSGTKGIYSQCRVLYGSCNITIANNQLNLQDTTAGNTGIGIAAFTTNGCQFDSLIISNNTINGDISGHISVYAYNADILNLSVIGNNCLLRSAEHSLYVSNRNTFNVTNITISGNVFKCENAYSCINLDGVSTARISNASVTGNVLTNGLYGIRTDYLTYLVEKNNIFTGVGQYYSFVHSDEIYIDSDNGKRVEVTSSTYTVNPDVTRIVNNNSASLTLTLPDPTTYLGKTIYVRNAQAYAVSSASSNVLPIGGLSGQTIITYAVDGEWVIMQSTGTYWEVVATNN